MAAITTRILGVSIESFFKAPILYKDAHCDNIAQKCFEAFSSYGLQPEKIAVRTADPAFNYDLSFVLFNGNGTFKFSSEKIELSLQNATSDKDLEVVADCIAKVYEHLPLPEVSNTVISGNSQTTAASVDEIQKYLVRHADPSKGVVHAGAIAYIICDSWPQEIRMTVDRSFVYKEGLFLTWTTNFPGKLSRDLLKSLQKACEEAASKLDLTFPPDPK